MIILKKLVGYYLKFYNISYIYVYSNCNQSSCKLVKYHIKKALPSFFYSIFIVVYYDTNVIPNKHCYLNVIIRLLFLQKFCYKEHQQDMI